MPRQEPHDSPGAPTPPAVTAPVPDWTVSEYLQTNHFENLAARRIELKLLSDEIDKELAELNLEISAMLATADLKSVVFGYHRLTLGSSTKGGRLSKERLLELGVTAEQLEQATTPRVAGAAFLTVTSIEEHAP